MRLFLARARAVRADFSVTDQNAPAIAGITARLQGMPLAIELAAARVKLLSPEQILGRLEEQLGILTSSARDLPDRQRTLRGAIEWSHDLLDEPHRRLLARLSVFRGGWELDAAEAVAGAGGELGLDVLEGLSDLVDQSLVRRIDEADLVRFSMLESIREFAAEMAEAAGDRPSTAGQPCGALPAPGRRMPRPTSRAPSHVAGSTASSATMTTCGRRCPGPSGGRIRRPRSASSSRCGASGSAAATSTRPAASWTG